MDEWLQYMVAEGIINPRERDQEFTVWVPEEELQDKFDFVPITEQEAQNLLATYPQPPWIRTEWHEQNTGFQVHPVVWTKDLEANIADDAQARPSPNMSGYKTNAGAKALRARREGKAVPPSTPHASDDEDSVPTSTTTRRRRGVHHTPHVGTPGSIGASEQLTPKVLKRFKDSSRSPAGVSFTTPKKVGGTRSRNNAGHYAQEEKTLDESLMVEIHDGIIGNMDVAATDYNVLMAAKDCLAHLA